MLRINIVLLGLLIGGCSIFKSTTTQEDIQTEQVEKRDVLQSMIEDIDITIPPEVFLAAYGVPQDTADKDTAEVRSQETSKKELEPVKISINRKQQTQDKTETTTEKKEEVQTEEVTERKTKGVLGGFGSVVVIIVIIAGVLLAIKIYA